MERYSTWRDLRGTIFAKFRLAGAVEIQASETMDEQHAVSQVLTERRDTYWCPHEGTEQAWIELDLQEERRLTGLVLMEHIETGQRIERFTLESQEGRWGLGDVLHGDCGGV